MQMKFFKFAARPFICLPAVADDAGAVAVAEAGTDEGGLGGLGGEVVGAGGGHRGGVEGHDGAGNVLQIISRPL